MSRFDGKTVIASFFYSAQSSQQTTPSSLEPAFSANRKSSNLASKSWIKWVRLRQSSLRSLRRVLQTTDRLPHLHLVRNLLLDLAPSCSSAEFSQPTFALLFRTGRGRAPALKGAEMGDEVDIDALLEAPFNEKVRHPMSGQGPL